MKATEQFAGETQRAITAGVTLTAIAAAAIWPSKPLAAAASAVFALAIIVAGIRKTKDVIEDAASWSATTIERETTRLTVWTLAWSSAALFLAYPIAGLRWQHGWQYATGYALLAIGFAVYLRRLSRPDETPPATGVRLDALLFAVAIFLASAWLIASGKLMTTHQDWLANDIFLASAAAVFSLTLTFLLRTRASR